MDEPSPAQTPAQTYLGQPVERFEDAALLTGRARYADDIAVPQGTLHAAIVRSAHASARIKAIDAAQALAMAGVTAILTGDEIRDVIGGHLCRCTGYVGMMEAVRDVVGRDGGGDE